MSQFSCMTTGERKMQAAAISREIYGTEDVEMDLGKKMCVPKEIMLEELSLASNRGSRLFKMRQKRSEKYTFESVQKPPGAPMSEGIVLQTQNGDSAEGQNGSSDAAPEVGPEAPDLTTEPDPQSIAPGYGGPLKDVPVEKFNITAVPKSYHSPWEQAISSDPALADALLAGVPEPASRPQLPGYKSFNRVATPFGGFGSPPRAAPTKHVDADPLPDYPDLHGTAAAAEPGRPTFNRHAAGWVSVGPPPTLPKVSLQAVLVPESDDL